VGAATRDAYYREHVMNLQIRFDDGTTEERGVASPCIFDVFDPVLKHPSEAQWYQWLPTCRCELSFCGRNVWTLDRLRGERAMVWRITNQDDATKALIGEWQSAYVESHDEQIERLTAERDAARRMVVLRSGGIKSSKEARELLALTNQAIEEGWFKVP
jgi:hypothetical protein